MGKKNTSYSIETFPDVNGFRAVMLRHQIVIYVNTDGKPTKYMVKNLLDVDEQLRTLLLGCVTRQENQWTPMPKIEEELINAGLSKTLLTKYLQKQYSRS